MLRKCSLWIATIIITFNINTTAAVPIDFTRNSNYTTDLISGLDWLDTSLTNNRSYNEVSSLLGSGAEFDGWRYATGLEAISMISHYTDIPNTNLATKIIYSPDNGRIENLIRLLDQTKTNPSIIAINGILSDVASTSPDRHLTTNIFWNGVIDQGSSQGYNSNNLNAVAQNGISSFLVRTSNQITVPEPTTIWLMALGILALFGFSSISRTNHIPDLFNRV